MAGNVYSWSTTAATNATVDSDINFAEGQLPGTVNDSARALMAGVAGFLKDTNATVSTTGSANAYAVASNIAIAALATGLKLTVKANFTNTDASTLNLTPSGGAAFGAKSIRRLTPSGDLPLTGGEIQNNGVYSFVYDTAANSAAGGWILLNGYRSAISPSNNLLINAAMEVSQETGTGTISAAGYIIDGWKIASAGGQTWTAGQVSDAPAGLKYSVKVTITGANAAPAATDKLCVFQIIEGKRTARLGFGAGGAQSIGIGFWVKANRTGTYSGSIQNGAVNRSYPFSFTINVSGTWEYKTVVIAGDVTGTWATDNTAGMQLNITMMAGSSNAGTANTWAASNFLGVTGTINGVAATSDFMNISGASIVEGGAPVPQDASVFTRQFREELDLCKVYYQKSFPYATVPAQNAGANTGEFQYIAISAGAVAQRSGQYAFVPAMRATPSFTFYNPSVANAQARDESAAADCSATATSQASESNFSVSATGNAGTAAQNRIGVHWTADARL